MKIFLSSNQWFYLQRFRLQVVLNMYAHSNPRIALKSAQEQEDRRWCRNERDRAWRAAETVEQRSERLRKWRERDHARHAAQTASERQATSQQRSTREHERMAAETSEEKETRSRQKSTRERERMAAETPEERERRLRWMKAIQTGPNASKASPDDAAGLDPVICIAHGARMMLTSNLWTEFGLVKINGAIICYKSGQATPNLPVSFMVQINSYPGPTLHDEVELCKCTFSLSPRDKLSQLRQKGGNIHHWLETTHLYQLISPTLGCTSNVTLLGLQLP